MLTERLSEPVVARKMNERYKYPFFADKLREEIWEGRLAPGTRLPSLSVLEQRFGSTRVTVLRAIEALVEHGYLRTEQRRGVYVSEHLPHVCHFAVVFPWGENHSPSQFYRAIQTEAAKLRDPQRHVSMFFEVGTRTDNEDYRRLTSWVASHRLAGLILAHWPHELIGSPILAEAGIPRVILMSPGHSSSLPSVYPDLDGFWRRSFERLAAAGRRRVAVLMMVQTTAPETVLDNIRPFAAACGLTLQPHWCHGVTLEGAPWIRHVTELMFRATTHLRPNGLVIGDDNLLTSATEGVVAAGVRAPEDVMITALANFPHPTKAAVPVIRIGFDIPTLTSVCIERLEQQRRGETPPAHTAIPAVFESERVS